MRVLNRLWRSRRGVSKIVSSLLMVVIVISMSVIVFAFYGPVFSALLRGGGIAPEDFTIIQASGQLTSLNGFGTPGPRPITFAGSYTCTRLSPVNSPVTGNVIVPAGEKCTVSAPVTGSIGVNFSGTLIVQGTSVSGSIVDDRAAAITIQNSNIGGPVQLWGTGSIYIANSQLTQGLLVQFASGTVQVQGNTMAEAAFEEINGVAIITNNRITGNLSFEGFFQCVSSGNTVGGTVVGQCTGKARIDIMNTGTSAVSFTRIYLNDQPWSNVNWTLAPGSSINCGNIILPPGSFCNTLPIVIPPKQMARIDYSWVPPDINSQVRIIMWSQANNYFDARIDPRLGLVCSTRSLMSPKVPVGYC